MKFNQNVIYTTTDYSIFRTLKGNREITDKRVNKIKRSIETILKYLNSQKYDHKQIYDWHIKGYSNQEIARHLGTNILVVARAIKKQEELL